ncbi:hypothetical protein [Burkholderia pseudomallei]|uniref:hypothetical protein n=1 Tax=Burkholderia pseudomallei TaxID=28450 RepID=UPI0012F4B7F5|nr:hypothetical protein [Burkholderia pseudomallei]
MGTQLPRLQIRRREKLFALGNELGEHCLMLAVFGIGQPGSWWAAVQLHQLRIVNDALSQGDWGEPQNILTALRRQVNLACVLLFSFVYLTANLNDCKAVWIGGRIDG